MSSVGAAVAETATPPPPTVAEAFATARALHEAMVPDAPADVAGHARNLELFFRSLSDPAAAQLAADIGEALDDPAAAPVDGALAGQASDLLAQTRQVLLAAQSPLPAEDADEVVAVLSAHVTASPASAPVDCEPIDLQLDNPWDLTGTRSVAVTGACAGELYDGLRALAAYLVEALPDTAQVLAAADTLLVALGRELVELADSTLAPSAEQAYQAAASLTAWADERAQAAAEPVVTADPGIEGSPDGLPDLDEGLGDAPTDTVGVAVGPGWPYLAPVDGPSPVDLTREAAGRSRCELYSTGVCLPPVTNRNLAPVFRDPVVQVVFWGPKWTTAAYASARAGVENLFRNMSGSAYQRILTQYYDATGFVSPGVTYAGSWVDTRSVPPGNTPTEDQVVQKAVDAYQAKKSEGWRRGRNVVWIVLGQQAGGLPSDADGDCGKQVEGADGAANRYVVGYVDHPNGRCAALAPDVRGGYTQVAAHEYAGAVTNPYSGTNHAWQDGLEQHLPDLCQAGRVPDGPGGELVQKLWSNGHGRCVADFAPTYSYEVTEIVPPPSTEENGRYTPGHRYPGATIEVRNTGTMPWQTFGAWKTYLRATTPACSPLYDRTAGSGWVAGDCRFLTLRPDQENAERLDIVYGELAYVVFSVVPDGTLSQGEPFRQSFTVFSGPATSMSPSAGARPELALSIARFDAQPLTREVFAVGGPGQDVTVQVDLLNTGTATWYPNQVLYVGTPQGTTSPYAAVGWPAGPGGCRNCRAHRIGRLVKPLDVYRAPITLHVPPGTASLTIKQDFEPVADVPVATGGPPRPAHVTNGAFRVTVLVLARPLGDHEVAGYGLVQDPPGTAASPHLGTGGFACLAVARAGALSTAVEHCSVTVWHADGSASSQAASGGSGPGPVAVLAGGVRYDPAAGDVAQVCWVVTAGFAGGGTSRHTGCTALP